MDELLETYAESLKALWQSVIERHSTCTLSIHGPKHWARVERNGLYIARRSGADPVVISLFAVFHDSCRINDGTDPQHGHRGAELAASMREDLSFVGDRQFELLVHACKWHTDRMHHDEPTIGACWDADRLDLGRVGIQPRSEYLNTQVAMVNVTDLLMLLSSWGICP